jgi:hypothetical protein
MQICGYGIHSGHAKRPKTWRRVRDQRTKLMYFDVFICLAMCAVANGFVHDACYLLACGLRAFVLSYRVSMYVHYCIHCIALMLLTLILFHYFFNFMPDSGGSHYVYVYTTENTEYIV